MTKMSNNRVNRRRSDMRAELFRMYTDESCWPTINRKALWTWSHTSAEMAGNWGHLS